MTLRTLYLAVVVFIIVFMLFSLSLLMSQSLGWALLLVWGLFMQLLIMVFTFSGLATLAIILVLVVAYGLVLSRSAAMRVSPKPRQTPYRDDAQEISGATPALRVMTLDQEVPALLGFCGLVAATPFVACRVTALLFGELPVAALQTDPSAIVGVPVIVSSWLLLMLHVELRYHASRRLRAWVAALGSTSCAVVLLMIAGGRVPLAWPDDLAARYGQLHDVANGLPDFVGGYIFECERGRSWGGAGPFFLRSLSWTTALSWLLATYAVLVVLTALSGLRVARRGGGTTD
jgi:hypothetical protein